MLETDSFCDWDRNQVICYFLSVLSGTAKECIDLYVLRPRVDLTLDGLKKALKNRFVDKNKET